MFPLLQLHKKDLLEVKVTLTEGSYWEVLHEMGKEKQILFSFVPFSFKHPSSFSPLFDNNQAD